MSQSQRQNGKEKQTEKEKQTQAGLEAERQREELKQTEDKNEVLENYPEESDFFDVPLDLDDSLPEYHEYYREFQDLPDDFYRETPSLETTLKHGKKIRASYIIYLDTDECLSFEFVGDKEIKSRRTIIEQLIQKQKKFLINENIDDLFPLQIITKNKQNFDERSSIVIDYDLGIEDLENDFIYLPSNNLYSLRFLIADEYGGGGKQGKGKNNTGISRNRIYYYMGQVLNNEDPANPLTYEEIASSVNDKYGARLLTSVQVSNIRNNTLSPEDEEWMITIFPSRSERRKK